MSSKEYDGPNATTKVGAMEERKEPTGCEGATPSASITAETSVLSRYCLSKKEKTTRGGWLDVGIAGGFITYISLKTRSVSNAVSFSR